MVSFVIFALLPKSHQVRLSQSRLSFVRPFGGGFAHFAVPGPKIAKVLLFGQ